LRGAYVADDTLDHLHVTLVSIQMHFAAFFAPLSPSVVSHIRPPAESVHAACQRIRLVIRASSKSGGLEEANDTQFPVFVLYGEDVDRPLLLTDPVDEAIGDRSSHSGAARISTTAPSAAQFRLSIACRTRPSP
jgi:hypothetical protein